MRKIKVKYAGECKRCSAVLSEGVEAMYEKSMGIFCVGCEPVEVEDIRQFRTLKAEAKADRYEGWAAKREAVADRQLNSYPEIRHDIAFCTQPGRIPFRDRMNRADDAAFQSLNKAAAMREKADSLRNVRVAGDADRARQAKRDRNDERFAVGSRVFDAVGGAGVIEKINKKTYKVKYDRGFTWLQDKSYFRPE